MKKSVLIFLLVFLVLSTSVMAALATNVWLQFTLTSQDPDPAEPGGIVDLRFKIENLGAKNAEDMIFELIPSYPFSLYGNKAQKEVGSVWGRQQGHLGTSVKYTIRVDENAVEGVNSIETRYKLKGGEWIKLSPFNVSIKSHDALVVVDRVYSEPAIIPPGSIGSVFVDVKNYGKTTVKDISLVFNVSSALPFVPFNQSNEQTIEEIKPGETASAEFVVGVEPDATADFYNVPLLMLYKDAGGRNYSKSRYIGVVVGGEPELLVQIDETDIYTKNSHGKVVVKFINRGLSDVKLLTAKLLDSDDYEKISSDEIYVGKIDSDDYETAEFKIFVKSVKDKVTLPISLEFRDANNAPQKAIYNLELPIYSGGEAKKLGLVEGSKATGFFILIIIVVGGVVGYKKWWKKRKKK